MVSLTVAYEDVPHLREMVREQLEGDRELLRDIIEGRERMELHPTVRDRIRAVAAFHQQLDPLKVEAMNRLVAAVN